MNKTAKKHNFLKIAAALSLVFAWVTLPFLIDDAVQANEAASDIRIGATLNGAAIGGVMPTGFAEHRYEPADSGERRRLSVQASSVNVPSGTRLDIYVNNALVGQIAVNNGSGFFDIDTNNGQTVPSVGNGNPIALRQGANVILSGTFGTVTASPSPSVSPSGSPNPSPSVSPSGSPSPTVSPSPTASPSPGGSPSPSPSPNGGNLFAALSGATLNGVLPNGFAQYEIHSSRTELEIRVYQVNLPSGTALAVFVNSTAVGNLILEGGGEGRLRLRSDRGQNVPAVTGGMPIRLTNGGATILSGTFSGASASPSPSPSPSASPSPTVSPSPSGSPSPSPSPSPSASPTPSQGRYFEANLTGVSAAANGEVKITLNQTENQAAITGEFHNLSSAETFARIVTNVGDTSVVYTFPIIGGTNGNFPNQTVAVSAAQVAQLRAGLWTAVIGSTNNPNGEIQGRLTTHGSHSDFDGDGSNDIAIFRPSAGTWYIQNTEGVSARVIGGANDKLVSGDFDGDGKTDAAVFKNVNGAGVWSIRRSSDDGTTETQFGAATDVPVRGDFDGDGRNDLTVYRPANGGWYIERSNGAGFLAVNFGANGDIPIAGDFDGDGRADVSVFRPANGGWYYLRSSDGAFVGQAFGQNGDVPLSGDFDGDGKADVGVFRPSNGVWYIHRSSDGAYDFRQFGFGTDVPVAGNYDGDGKTDIAIFRPSNGVWYIWRSSDNGFAYQYFGQSGDIPTPAR